MTDELCRLLRISREDLIANLGKSMFGFVHPDDIGRMAYFGKNFAAHTDEKYDVFFRWKTPKMEDYHIFHSWANHVLVDGVSLGFFFYSDAEESGKNNQILDTHYQKYANDLFLFYVIGQACIVLRRYWFRQSSWYNYILHQANGTLFVAAGPMNCPACITAWPCGNTSPTTASRRLAWP